MFDASCRNHAPPMVWVNLIRERQHFVPIPPFAGMTKASTVFLLAHRPEFPGKVGVFTVGQPVRVNALSE
jgi:hypothetical protein